MLAVKNPLANAGDARDGSISGLGRSPGGGNGNWWATVHGGHRELDMTAHTHTSIKTEASKISHENP